MVRTGLNVTRQTTSGREARNVLNHVVRDSIVSGSPPLLQRAIVYDIICDTSSLDENYLNSIAQMVNNAELVDIMPINSVIARIVSNQGGVMPATYTILFPFFSSHLELSVKPGEQVYVIYEDYENTGYKVGYWLTRGSTQQTIEDPNYTHMDRRFDPTMNPDNYRTADQASLLTGLANVPPIGFPNGGNSVDTLTLVPSGNLADNPYDGILQNSIAAKYVTYEPVPRWKKRPQEVIFQGTNNALLMLGEDRNGPISGAIQQTPIDVKGQSGAIDLVVGRGRFFSATPGLDPRQGSGTTNPPGSRNTSPLLTENSRGHIETDKAPYRTNKIANPIEGDPDPLFDAARIYVVQQSRVDENYRLVRVNEEGILYPENTLSVTQPAGNGPYGRSYVVNKADNIRIIGRKNDDSGINGTVLIIREGIANNDLGYIFINEEGKIQIEAPKIYVGKATGEEEPYIKYTKFKETVEHLQAQIDTISQYIGNILGNVIPLAFVTSNAVPYAPVASLASQASGITTATTNMTTNISTKSGQTPNKILSVRSEKIFGQ